MTKVLVVDDEKLIVKGIRFSLEQDNMEVDCAYDGEEAMSKAKEKEYDVILLDVMLPKADGFEVLQTVREFSEVPVIMLTAKGNDMDKILGLEYGADDYITKPYSFKELAARIYAQVRRSTMQGFSIDYQQQLLTVGGRVIPLAQKEYALFIYLLGNPNRILSAEELYHEVWHMAKTDTANTVAVHIARLRRKLDGTESIIGQIVTVRGEGYRFLPKTAATVQ